MKTSPSALIAGLVLASSAVLADEPRRPNVVFVLLDDFGYSDLGCTGAKDIRTPHIDRLASEGVRFTDFYANAPVCTPTRTAFITGRYQQRVGLEWALGYTAEQFRRVGDRWVEEPDKLALGLPTSEATLPRQLKKAGYTTAAFGKWHLGFAAEFNPLRHGFDEYFGTLLGHADYYRFNYFDGTHHLYEGEKPVKVEGYHTDLVTDRAVAFVERMGRRPFFLYVPYMAVHWPFQPPDRPDPPLTKENRHDGTRRDYVAMVERIDRGVGRMLAVLDKQDVLDDTLFIFSSDNGGERLSNNAPLFNHKATLWEGGIRVPCLMRWPRRLPKGEVTSLPAITMDLTATILAAAGAGAGATNDAARRDDRDGRKLDGIDLLPLLTGERKATPRTFCWRIQRTGRHQKAVRHGDWKFVQDDMVEMLFDLKHDISERRDLAYQHPDVVRQLKKRLADWEADVDSSSPAFRVR
jgi:arylsulfatase A-like enzyme